MLNFLEKGRWIELSRPAQPIFVRPSRLGTTVAVDRDEAIVRDADVTVAQPLRDNLNRHADFGKQRGVCVAETVEADAPHRARFMKFRNAELNSQAEIGVPSALAKMRSAT